MKKGLSTFIVLWAVWLLIAGFSINELLLGGVVALILAFILTKHVNYSFNLAIIPGLLKFIFIYLPIFIYKLVAANLDMAYRVLSPKLPIRPAIVKVPTKIQSEMGKLVLANSITLTPGTLSLDAEDDHILVHWVNVQGTTADEHQSHISKSFENVLGGIFK